jgi:asparagine synthase (glutamine-hydrolysing)
MSGIAGIARRVPTGVSAEVLGRMASSIRHRGPDGYGFYLGQRVGFAHVRLSVVDVFGGAQPMINDAGQIVLTYNGEIYNHPELRRELEDKGHVFKTRSDAEVLIHGYEEWGVQLLKRLNGEFAFAIYDRASETVLIARDRFGVRPLFYAQSREMFCFGSEIKAILATGEVDVSLDRRGLDEVFSFTTALPPRTPFAGIASLEPGTYGVLKDGALWLHRYYEIDFPESEREPEDGVEQLDEIMLRSVGMRMRSDVPVGAYLSGGLDSSITASLAASASSSQLRSFSVSLDSSSRRDGALQREIASGIGAAHATSVVSDATLARSFARLLWHTETPLLRTAPALMFQLAKLAKDQGMKVVIAGDGGDELFLGQDVFREASIRRFCLRDTTSCGRFQLFDRVYPELFAAPNGDAFWRRLFLEAGSPRDPLFSHLPRYLLASRVREFYSGEFKAGLQEIDVLGELRGSLPVRYFGWSALNQAAYLEMTTFFSPYTLGAQADRVAMAHGVENRFPFLDPHLFEFAASLPTGSRLRGLKDKEILRRWASRILPPSATPRRKKSYNIDMPSFFGSSAPNWVADLMTPEAIRRVGVFSPAAVGPLVKRHRANSGIGFVEDQALIGVLSTQLWHHQFIQSLALPDPLPLAGASVALTEAAPAYT